MYRYLFGRREEYGGRRGRRPRSRAAGCLLWLIVLIVVLVVLSLLFGGFQKGTKADGPPHPAAAVASGWWGPI
jgi:hypothetical protein